MTRLWLSSTATLALCLVSGCTSADTTAANKAAEAQADYDQGRFVAAARAIRKALAARDDNVDYWLLKAHIDLKMDDPKRAFGDYEYAIQLDHSNLEALQALCELGTSAGPPDRVENYADQLLVLTPDAAPALTAKGYVALLGGDMEKAEALADRVLAQDPQNIQALTLKARTMIAHGKYADAATLIEKTSESPANAVPKLQMLLQIYERAHDRPSYDMTFKRLALAAPDTAEVQLKYADTLYQDGQNDLARSVVQKVLEQNPANYHDAAAALDVWMIAGPQALDPGRMVAGAARCSLLMKAAYAQFANESGHPDIAIAILRGSDRGDPTPDNSNAKAAFAYALGVTGHRAEALAQLNAILDADHDPNQPWALLARARLLAANHDYVNAIRDARLLVANDPDNATAHLALADILRASGSADLSNSALREGLSAIPDSTRLATRLAATLAAQGDTGKAAQVARDLARASPMDQRAQHLLQIYGASFPDTVIG